jgi:hypothetical protein
MSKLPALVSVPAPPRSTRGALSVAPGLFSTVLTPVGKITEPTIAPLFTTSPAAALVTAAKPGFAAMKPPLIKLTLEASPNSTTFAWVADAPPSEVA